MTVAVRSLSTIRIGHGFFPAYLRQQTLCFIKPCRRQIGQLLDLKEGEEFWHIGGSDLDDSGAKHFKIGGGASPRLYQRFRAKLNSLLCQPLALGDVPYVAARRCDPLLPAGTEGASLMVGWGEPLEIARVVRVRISRGVLGVHVRHIVTA